MVPTSIPAHAPAPTPSVSDEKGRESIDGARLGKLSKIDRKLLRIASSIYLNTLLMVARLSVSHCALNCHLERMDRRTDRQTRTPQVVLIFKTTGTLSRPANGLFMSVEVRYAA
ncbi:hypothetical protein LOAG_00952 [Loa loa]|uniref:Uncharacterized protein n=1 Tax=Loa loa TaxID=7209 RepID=A0A1S0UAB3_LOALO|nr:hypothetical protein LOAG_00952 [Loa loa]EFO27522.1 hypothetical protein LOAG_00952 [Loa loa]